MTAEDTAVEAEESQQLDVEKRLRKTRKLLHEETRSLDDYRPPLVAGVDLGTSNIQMIVLDSRGKTIYADFKWDDSVRDGVVVDYSGAREVVARFKSKFEDLAPGDESLNYAAVGYPPGTEAWVESNVVEDCQFEILAETPEPSAAAAALEVKRGVIVDVGGGTTGISVLKSGAIVHTADEATGGHHLSLVIAGNRDLSYEEAEKFKREQDFSAYSGTVKPVIQKMASIVQSEIRDYPEVEKVYLVGGSVIPEGIEDIFSDVLNRQVNKPNAPILVTPLGIACSGVNRLSSGNGET